MTTFLRKARRALIVTPLKRFRGNVVTGVLVVIPLFATVYIFYKIFDLADSILPSAVHAVAPRVPADWAPGVGILLFVILACLIGILTKNYFGSRIIATGNGLIARIPLISKVYVGLQQIIDAAVSSRKAAFQHVVLVEFPRPGCRVIGFMTANVSGELAEKMGNDKVTVFVPTGPSPTHGFVLFLPESQVVKLSMNVETAFKIVMSAGIVSLDALQKDGHRYGVPRVVKKWNWLANLRRWDKEFFPDPRD